MNKRSRTILFYICLILFLLASPLAILFSQGYRLDFHPETGGKIIVKTGGLFLKIEPKQTAIYLDGELKTKTNFLSGSSLIKNLLPKNYAVLAKKEGFLPWEKNLKINEKEVTEAKSIILFPENLSFTLLAENEKNPFLEEVATNTIPKNILAYQKIDNDVYYLDNGGFVFKSDASFLPKEKLNQTPFFIEPGLKYNLKLSPDGKKIVYFSDYEIWILFVQDIFDQPQKKAGDKLFLTRFSEKIGDVFWLNSDYLVFSAGNKIKIAETDDRDTINIYDIGEFTNPTIKFTPADNKLYILSEGKTYVSASLLP